MRERQLIADPHHDGLTARTSSHSLSRAADTLPFTPGLILYVFGIFACRFVLEAYRAPLSQYMTTMSNEAIVAELGWTMQIIYDQNGGRVPKYWVSGN